MHEQGKWNSIIMEEIQQVRIEQTKAFDQLLGRNPASNLPPNPEPNPKGECKSVHHLRSGKTYASLTTPEPSITTKNHANSDPDSLPKPPSDQTSKMQEPEAVPTTPLATQKALCDPHSGSCGLHSGPDSQKQGPEPQKQVSGTGKDKSKAATTQKSYIPPITFP